MIVDLLSLGPGRHVGLLHPSELKSCWEQTRYWSASPSWPAAAVWDSTITENLLMISLVLDE